MIRSKSETNRQPERGEGYNSRQPEGRSDITLAFAVTSLQDKLGCGLAVGPRWFLVNMMPDVFFSDNIPFFLKCMPKASSWIALLFSWRGYFRVWLKVLRKDVHDCKTSQTTVESKFKIRLWQAQYTDLPNIS